MADVNERCVQAGHQFSDFADKNVADGEVVVGFLVVQFDQFPAFQQGLLHARRGGVDDKFFIHFTKNGLPTCNLQRCF